MRNVVGEVTLEELLSQRDKLAERIRDIVDKETDAWGIQVNNVELKDIVLPEFGKLADPDSVDSLSRAMIDIYANSEIFSKNRAAIRDKIIKKFGVESVLDKLMKVYEGIL